MREAGAVAVSDDGKWLADGALLRRAPSSTPASSACRSSSTARTRASRAARRCTRAPSRRASAWPASPRSPKSAAVARDLLVAELTGGRLHVAHLSTARALELVRRGEGRRPRGHLRGDAAPPRADRRGGRVVRVLDPHEDESAAARGVRTSRRSSRGSRTARSTRSPRITRRTTTTRRRWTSTRRRSASSGSRRRPPSSTTGSSRTGSLLARRDSRRSSRRARRAGFGLPGGTLAPGSPADVTLFDPEARRGQSTPRRFRLPGAQHAVRRLGAHRARPLPRSSAGRSSGVRAAIEILDFGF